LRREAAQSLRSNFKKFKKNSQKIQREFLENSKKLILKFTLSILKLVQKSVLTCTFSRTISSFLLLSFYMLLISLICVPDCF